MQESPPLTARLAVYLAVRLVGQLAVQVQLPVQLAAQLAERVAAKPLPLLVQPAARLAAQAQRCLCRLKPSPINSRNYRSRSQRLSCSPWSARPQGGSERASEAVSAARGTRARPRGRDAAALARPQLVSRRAEATPVRAASPQERRPPAAGRGSPALFPQRGRRSCRDASCSASP